LDFDPSYPKNPKPFGDYIRIGRMDKGLLIRELADQLGVTEDTVVNWEERGKVPRIKNLRERLSQSIDGVGKWLESEIHPWN
jgi:DNA-binding transcriptional regulator YiaG